MFLICLIGSGCTLLGTIPDPGATGTPDDLIETPTTDENTGTGSPRGSGRWSDASEVMQGICFEAANDAAGRVFVIRSSAELDTFFGLADNSELCRRPVKRGAFDFEDGRVLVGVWSSGRGCTAQHDVERFRRDNDAETITIRLTLVIEGDCPYELVRPFWIGIPNGQDYDITLTVNAPQTVMEPTMVTSE